MKLNLSLPVLCILAFAGPLPAQESDQKHYEGEEDVNTPDTDAKAMLGTFVGAFGERKITICLDRVIGNTVTGYSIVAGNERAFSGSWSKIGGDFAVVAKEPGDHKADGVFRFTYLGKTQSLLGEWEADDKQIGLRKFNLPARKFKYNPKAGRYPQSSTRELTEKDVENLKNEELRIMRNEIYARHGYSFKLADMREHFDKLDWYMPMAIDITTKLTKVEKANAELIKRYEKYSAEFYDGFGR
ncbi:MAG: YARHG domain-containing protein [Verrucomicrobiota bacterium]